MKLALYIGLVAAINGATASPLDLLKQQSPDLYQLYRQGSSYVGALEQYARGQGFRNPVENLAVVTHELVHIFSAVHQGFYIKGTYYEPYLNPSSWPSMTNSELIGKILPSEMSNITSLYARNTPNNTLGNVVDELNAHSQVAEFICRNEPQSGDKQVRNIFGHLLLQEAFLRNIRIAKPAEYKSLSLSKTSRGAMFTITTNSWTALARCGANPNLVAQTEVRYLFSLPQ